MRSARVCSDHISDDRTRNGTIAWYDTYAQEAYHLPPAPFTYLYALPVWERAVIDRRISKKQFRGREQGMLECSMRLPESTSNLKDEYYED